MTQQSGDNANRLSLIRNQIGKKPGAAPTTEERPVAPVKEETQPVAPTPVPPMPSQEQTVTVEAVPQPAPGSDRRRHSLYFSDKLNTELERSFRQVAHDLFPRVIEKSDFLEACFLYCLEHVDEVREALRETAREL